MHRETDSASRSDMKHAENKASWLRRARPLRVHLSVLIVLLLASISAPLIWLTYEEGRDAALDSAAQQMRLLSGSTVQLYRSAFSDGHAVISLGAVLPSLDAEPPFFLRAKREFFTRTLNGSPHLDGIYVGYPSGSFVEVMRVPKAAPWRLSIGAPEATIYGMQVIQRNPDGKAISTWSFLDHAGEVLSSGEPQETDFDPRTRLWYKEAVEASGPISTDPYVAAITDALTITLANSMEENRQTVIGVDVLLETVSQLLIDNSVSEHSVGYVFNEDGELIVHSDPVVMAALLDDFTSGHSIVKSVVAANEPEGESVVVAGSAGEGAVAMQRENDPVLQGVERLLGTMPAAPTGQLAEYNVAGNRWMAHVTSVGIGPAHLLENYKVVIAAPVSDFIAESVALLKRKMMIAGMIVFFGILLALFVSRGISRTLVALAGDANQIGNLDFTNWSVKQSLITEINLLGRALSSARDAIRTFTIYVPRDLVRQIVASGQEAAGTAVRREVTVLFTDIRDFTTISEVHTPEEVVEMLAVYFETMNKIVEQHNGVLVQYIGDSIYAMWNAPTENADHVADGCRCTLALKAAIDDLNAHNARNGRTELITRYGLHTGVAVIGSFGAEDRRQYTAMGDTVNVASRLEEMNKQFGTTILASAAVKQRAGVDLEFRALGSASVKGRKEQVEIFELLEGQQANVEVGPQPMLDDMAPPRQ